MFFYNRKSVFLAVNGSLRWLNNVSCVYLVYVSYRETVPLTFKHIICCSFVDLDTWESALIYSRLDPDPGGQKMTRQKNKNNEEIYWMFFIFWGLESSLAGASFMKAQRYIYFTAILIIRFQDFFTIVKLSNFLVINSVDSDWHGRL